MKNKNIEDVFCPDRNKLKRNKDGSMSIKIVDAELDVIKCEFSFEDCVKIDTKGYTYIRLSRSNLYEIIEAIEETEDIFWDECNNKWDELNNKNK